MANRNYLLSTFLRFAMWPIAVVFFLHGLMLLAFIHSSFYSSPTFDESAHFASGLFLARSEDAGYFKVNPPTNKWITATALFFSPTLRMTSVAPSSSFPNSMRPEFIAGDSILELNRDGSFFPALVIARLARIPFFLLASWMLWQLTCQWPRTNRLLCQVFWCTSPLLLGHGWIVSADALCGVAMCFIVWTTNRLWKNPTWIAFAMSGLAWGLAIGTKFTFGPLYLAYPLAVHLCASKGWTTAMVMRFHPSQIIGRVSVFRRVLFACRYWIVHAAVACLVVNSQYLFHETAMPIGKHDFIGITFRSLTIPDKSDLTMIKSCKSLVTRIPSPFPRSFLEGVDQQMADMDRPRGAYLLGSRIPGEIYWFHLVGYAMKEQLAVLLAATIGLLCFLGRRLPRKLRRIAMSKTVEDNRTAMSKTVGTTVLLSLTERNRMKSHSNSPLNLIVLLLANMACVSKVYGQEVIGWPAQVRAIQYFSSADNSLQPSLFYDPGGDEPKPLLIALHSWSGDYTQANPAYGDWCIAKGWVLMHPNFRGVNQRPEACGSELVVQDILSAVEYAKKNCKIDENRIYLIGTSGGGYNSLLMAGRAPEIWAGVSAWCPIYDLKAWHAETEQRKLQYTSMLEKVCGGPPGASVAVDEQYRIRSASAWLANAKNVNLSINTGITDGHNGSVPVSQTLNAFNGVAAAADQIPSAVISEMIRSPEIPTTLRQEVNDELFQSKPAIFRRVSGKTQVTIFQGGHDIIFEAGLGWLEQQSKNKPPMWQVQETPRYKAEQIFVPVEQQTHAPGIVEMANGDLLASWYGDAEDADAAVLGSRKTMGENTWSDSFVMADRRWFPDCNTCMMIDSKAQLWLFWPTIVGSSWESCLMNYRVSTDYQLAGTPKWDREGLILLKPDDFAEEAIKLLGDGKIKPPRGAIGGPDAQVAKLRDPLFQRMGWAPRCKPTILPTGRILLPLYSDTFAISIMAVSDDGGTTWYASKPLIGFGNIQPTVLRRDNGTLVAYMRENGPRGCIRVSESSDDGLTWGPVGDSELPNPGSGIDGVRLANGHWALIYNDSKSSRASLVVSLSDDEGRTWKTTRHLEKHAAGRYHYPAIIQGRDGRIHAIYSCFIASEEPAVDGKKKPELKGIKHVVFNEAWIRAGAE